MKCETNLRDGIRKMSETNRPGLVIIHKSTCSACVSLKPKLLASREIDRLSNSFVVISLVDDAEPREKKWLPDGKYFPRIFFLDPAGRILSEVFNTEGNQKFKYYYSNERSLVRSMERVLKSYPVEAPTSFKIFRENERTMKCDFNLSQGLKRMRASQQPGMIIIYKTWCPVCAELKSSLVSSREIDHLSNFIVVVMLKDEDEPGDRAFAPDGTYIPRIFFTSPEGNIIYNVYNTQGDPRYKYFYTVDRELIPNMKSIINYYASYGKLLRNSCFSHVKTLRHSFGTNLKWETNLETGLQKIVRRQKPGMAVFHKSWCGACRALKTKFEVSKDIENLSPGFVLISLADDNHPRDSQFMPDGDYVPRIMFISPQGAVLAEVINAEGSSDYKYFYSDAESIALSMKTVLHKFPDA